MKRGEMFIEQHMHVNKNGKQYILIDELAFIERLYRMNVKCNVIHVFSYLTIKGVILSLLLLYSLVNRLCLFLGCLIIHFYK